MLLTLLVGAGIFIDNKLLDTKELVIDEVIHETSTNSSMFAIMITDTGLSYDGDKWPDASSYEFDAASSYCMDSSGNKEYGIISYNSENNAVKFYTTSFASCTLYFKESKITDLTKAYNKYGDINTIISSDGTKDIEDIWESTLTNDGYRYVGTDPDNYICFGTDDVDKCTSNTDLYMYRIIGIFADSSGNYHLKLIKKEALNTTYQWHSSNSDVDWGSSSLYNGLNGSYFLTNSQDYSYMRNSTWKNMITTWTWTAVNTSSHESPYGAYYGLNTSTIIYYHETKQLTKLASSSCYYASSTSSTNACQSGEWTTVKAKIGLMYVSDYMLSLGSKALNYASRNSTSLKTGWIYLENNDELSSEVPIEWTMSRPGCDSGGCSAYNIQSTGFIGASIVYWDNANYHYVRPVFYLTNSATVISGTGAMNDPYILET